MVFSLLCCAGGGLSLKAAFSGWGEYLKYGVPAALMICLEWWVYEAVILMSGEGAAALGWTDELLDNLVVDALVIADLLELVVVAQMVAHYAQGRLTHCYSAAN